MASFLTGYEKSAERDAMPSYPSYRTTYLGFFVQDDICISEKLTPNLGLRWKKIFRGHVFSGLLYSFKKHDAGS